MRDPVHVDLSVPVECTPKVDTILAREHWEPDDVLVRVSGGVRRNNYAFSNVDFGELPFLHMLIEEGIPYTARWEKGCTYPSGAAHGRFTNEGKKICKQLYDNELDVVPLSRIESAVSSEDWEQVRSIIKNRKEYLSVLPWKNQYEYGRLYLTRKLIDPTWDSLQAILRDL